MEQRLGLQHRLLCLLAIICMLFVGAHVEENHVDSLSAYPSSGTVSLQRVSSGQKTVIYRDNSALSRLESATLLRTSGRAPAGLRLAYWLAAFAIPAALLLKFLIGERSVCLYAACTNQYRFRTLEYIHHKDGKKA